jgi:hypothetical protein
MEIKAIAKEETAEKFMSSQKSKSKGGREVGKTTNRVQHEAQIPDQP